jgi:hypothetical protein
MQFVIDQYSLASLPLYWYPVAQPPIPPYPPIFPPPFPPPFPQWPSVHVHYTEAHLPAGVDPNPEIPIPAPTLRYQDGTQILTFSGDQITSQETVVGRLLSVPLVRTVDQGDTLFSLFLPQVTEPAAGALTPVSTIGVTTRVAGPITLPKPQQAMQYSTMNFTGTLSTIQLPPGSK